MAQRKTAKTTTATTAKDHATAERTIDPSMDIIQQRRLLDAIFTPRSVAIIGATERAGTVGRTLTWNLVTNPFGGTVYPVNPNRANVLGVKAYPSVGAIPERIDLAVVVTPAPTVPQVIA